MGVLKRGWKSCRAKRYCSELVVCRCIVIYLYLYISPKCCAFPYLMCVHEGLAYPNNEINPNSTYPLSEPSVHGTLAEMTGTYRTYMDPVSTTPKDAKRRKIVFLQEKIISTSFLVHTAPESW